MQCIGFVSFSDRRQAGKLLADRLALKQFAGAPVVIALPRGGVPVAAEVARALGAPLDVLIVRKIGAPDNPEYGLGAITEGGIGWVDMLRLQREGLRPEDLAPIRRREQEELERRLNQYRQGRERVAVEGRTAILVDDGLATGVSARVACRYLRSQGARQVILAVPVCPASARNALRGEVDELVCVEEPQWFASVGAFYEDFRQVTDEDVLKILARPASPPPSSSLQDGAVTIGGPGIRLRGVLSVPSQARGLVLFAHGSGSNYLSPRNRAVAARFRDAGLATLLFDLLTPDESEHHDNVFDIPLLASRLELATSWVARQPSIRDLGLGYFGASTGAAAALWAAAELGPRVSAVVSRGGRPDLAVPRLRAVLAPTLLIVGGRDEEVLLLNRRALKLIERGRLSVIPNATHLFEEPGAIEEVGHLALDWFERHLPRARSRTVA